MLCYVCMCEYIIHIYIYIYICIAPPTGLARVWKPLKIVTFRCVFKPCLQFVGRQGHWRKMRRLKLLRVIYLQAILDDPTIAASWKNCRKNGPSCPQAHVESTRNLYIGRVSCGLSLPTAVLQGCFGGLSRVKLLWEVIEQLQYCTSLPCLGKCSSTGFGYNYSWIKAAGLVNLHISLSCALHLVV